jgi:putative hydrolase of the HAD superfamily
MIKAVLFDADGVVINPPMQFSRHLQEAYALTPETTRPFFSGIFQECLLGRVNLEDALPPFLPDWGWKGSTEEFIALWLEKDACPDLRLLDAIQDLRGKGILCGLATLQERRRAAYLRAQMGFERRFDRFFFSCELGCLKPDPTYYARVQDLLGLPGSEILFWDDAPKNVSAARTAGWNAEVYTSFEAFREIIKKSTGQ